MKKILDFALSDCGKIILDYLFLIIPIIVSCVAIWISISNSKKENKIAMFNVRYMSISQMQTVLNFAKGIEGCDDSRIVLRLFDSLWGTNGIDKTFADNLIQYRCKLEQIKNEVLQSKFTFKQKFVIDLADIVYELHLTIMAAINNSKDLANHVNELTAMCNVFYEKDYKKFVKQCKI
jgi:hypothetical protein